MDLSLLSQPWTIQLSLGAGYASYTLAYAGIRQHHTSADIFFKSVLFSLFAALVLAVLGDFKKQYFVTFLAVALPLTLALFWRLWAFSAYNNALHKFGYTADESPSAWHSISHDEDHDFTQVAVLTKDNDWLRCDDLSKFNKCPGGPVILGPHGDVALYLTHLQEEGKENKELKSTLSKDFGDRMAYIPSEQIKRVNFRRSKA